MSLLSVCNDKRSTRRELSADSLDFGLEDFLVLFGQLTGEERRKMALSLLSSAKGGTMYGPRR